MKINLKNEQGITLVALIITIIVLVILAAITISVAFNSGIINTAVNGTVNYATAQRDEQVTFDKLDENLQDIISRIESYNIGGRTPFGALDNTKKEASDGDWYIPKGFIEAEDSGKTIKEGKVIKDEAGNEWVWIPCYVDDGIVSSEALAIEYTRTNFKENDITNYTEILDSKDKASIKKYGGYYIGRYEAGADREVINGYEPSENTLDATREVLIQKDKHPYNLIIVADMKTKSESFAKDNRYDENKVYTKIVSSYAWDTAINFIQETEKYEDYGTNSPQGNYGGSSGRIVNTGLTTAVCNIYDMGGNLFECTSESYSINDFPYVYRGGGYNFSASDAPAGCRANGDGIAYPNMGFRLTLYLM